MIRIIHVSDLHFGKTMSQTDKSQRLLKYVFKAVLARQRGALPDR